MVFGWWLVFQGGISAIIVTRQASIIWKRGKSLERISGRFASLGRDGAPAKLGLMGGTFDPIHNGHLRIAEEVREELGLDGVLFIPTGNPVFKRDQHVTDAHVRLERCRRAVEPNPHFDVSPIEVDRAGDTFTVDTLRELRGAFPDSVEFYFIVGSDAAQTIGKWRGVRELAGLTHLVVAAGRPGYADADELRKVILAVAPFELHVVNVSQLEISSSDIRARLEAGKSVRYLVPEATRRQIEAAGTPVAVADLPAVGVADPSDKPGDDPLSKAFFKARKAELECRVGPKRFKHSLGVSDTCAELAERYGLDVRKARLAGLLHDWDKGLDDEGARARVRELGMEDALDPWVVENMPRVLHGHTAAVALGRAFPQIPADVLQAIDRHTTAAEDMSDLDKALYIADALEPSRKFGRIDELREAAKTATLDELYFQTYEYWTLLLFERRQPLHPDTMRIWNANVLRWQAEKEKRKK